MNSVFLIILICQRLYEHHIWNGEDGGGDAGVGLEEAPPPAGVIELIDPMEVHRMFVHSERLNSEAVVEFVRALCRVSLEELRSDRPRVFALTKIVEIAHFNMSRIRLVWTRIWNVLADYFITVSGPSSPARWRQESAGR